MATTIVELLRQRAAEQPDQRAYTFLVDGEADEVHLTYAQLDRAARSVAVLLRTITTDDERVLLLYPPGLDYIVAFFGCMYAGMIPVPVYPPDPARLQRTIGRLQAIVGDAHATIALTTETILAMATFLFAQAPDLARLHWRATDALLAREAEDPAGWRDPRLRGDSLAFLQYTSGSTGTPKGVMLTHANLLHNLHLIRCGFGITSESTGVIWLPPYHDMGLIGGILQPLYSRFPVTLLSPIDFLKRPLRWLQAVSRYGATVSGGPNFAYDLCVRKTTPEERVALDLSQWDVAFNGAEPVRAETIERFAEAFAPSGFRREAFYPCYGLAEATLIVTGGIKAQPPDIQRMLGDTPGIGAAVQVAATDPQARALVSSGRALDALQVAIVQPSTYVPCAADQVGEIWVAGPSVASGYWRHPDETARTFHAHLTTGAGPFLRTGDLGFLHNGALFVTGRLKDLIIIRGRNYYPQDIERTLEQCHRALRPGCGAAFTIERDGEAQLVVVHEVERRTTTKESGPIVGAIRQAIADEHALRVAIVVLIQAGTIAKTSSGKIQRYACREAFLSDQLAAIARDEHVTAPAGGDGAGQAHLPSREDVLALEPALRPAMLESALQALVAEYVQCRPGDIPPDQPLSHWGLDSLLAAEIKSAIETHFGVAVSFAQLLAGISVQELAAAMLGHLAAAPPVAPDALLRSQGRLETAPLSFAQERFWFLNQLDPGNHAYHCPTALMLRGPLHSEALEQALEAVARRHDLLRVTFQQRDGTVVQVVSPTAKLSLPVIDVLVDAPAHPEELVRRLVAAEIRKPFDLAQGPLMRAVLLRLASDTHMLVVTLHHIIADGWSMGLLSREVAALYAAFTNGTPAPLAELPIQYTDYAVWQRQQVREDALEVQLAYWIDKLKGRPPVLALPADRPRPASPVSHGAAQTHMLAPELLAQLKVLGQREHVTLFMLLLAAFKVVLFWRTRQADVIVGTAIVDRNHPLTRGLIGCFLNMLVLRTDLAGNPTFQELLGRVRATTLAAYEHQDLPFERLVGALRTADDLAHNPIVQVAFGVQNTPKQLAQLQDLAIEPYPVEQQTARYDLTLWVSEVGEAVTASWTYSTDLFDSQTITRMHHDFEALLQCVATRDETRLHALEALVSLERKRRSTQATGWPRGVAAGAASRKDEP